MNWRRQAYAAGAALVYFLVMSLLSQSWGPATMIAAGFILLVCMALFLHYRRRGRAQALAPVTPARDDRVIPRDVRTFVIARDDGKCQLRLPGCLIDSQIDIDHKVPYAWGGSSKDPGNLQCACHPCNQAKSDRWADTPMGRLNRRQYMRLAA